MNSSSVSSSFQFFVLMFNSLIAYKTSKRINKSRKKQENDYGQ